MNLTEPIQIPLSKKKIILIFLGSVLFVLLGISFIIYPESFAKYGRSSTKIIVVGVIGTLFFGACAVYAFRKLLDTKPGLIINKIGLIDNSSGAAVGQILWSDIRNISVVEIHKQKLIMLKVKNPQEYIDKQTSGFKKRLMKINLKMYGTPLSITSNALQIKFEELINILNKHRNEAGTINKNTPHNNS